MKTRFILFFLVCLCLCGCLNIEDIFKGIEIPVSLHPLYTKDDVVFEESLVGTWKDNDTEMVITKDHNNEYYLLKGPEEKDEGYSFIAHLLKLNEIYFLDLAGYPSSRGTVNPMMIPGHWFAKVDYTQSQLNLSFVDLTKMDPNVIDREIVEERVILTASPKKMQRFLLSNLNNAELFTETMVYKKIKGKKIR